MFPRDDIVIADVDGTLVNVSGIRHHVMAMDADGNYKQKNFDAFHRAAIDCPPIEETIAQLHDFRKAGKRIIIVTARSQKYGRQTAFWLAMHKVPSDAMIMRREGDMRKDVEVKRDMLRFNILPRWNPVHAIDDNPNVIGLWVEHGIPVTVVPGYEE